MNESIRDEILTKRLQFPSWLVYLLIIFIISGVAAFLSRALGKDAGGAWQILLVNFLFWTGVSQAGIIFSCALRITNARWARPLLRISEGFGSFLPVSFILLIVIFIGKNHILPYATEHYHSPKDIWLNIPFVMSRDIGGFFILIILSFLYLYYSLRQDLGGIGDRLSGISGWISSRWKGEIERNEIWRKIRWLAPAVVLAYVVVFSFFAWDLMMSLDPLWLSTLFGPFYFVGSLVAAIGTTIIFSVFVRKYTGLQDYITERQYHDMGKLLLGFSMFWVYLFYSQYLPIWYGNMPEEATFVFKRVRVEPFTTLSWVVLSCCFVFPFFTLLSRTHKIVKPILVFIATVSITGFWLEKYVLVVPSLTNEFNFGLIQVLITLGFAAGFILTFILFVRAFPIIPFGDPYFDGKAGSNHSGGH